MEKSQNAIFNRTELLIGNEAMNLLTQKKVIIFGIGGVGSWTAEALIRTGITNLTLVDADKIAQSNINRQVPATTLTIGAPKAEAMRNHLLTINPNANITTINPLYTASTAEQFNLGNYDYIIDAIDSLADKHLLIINATRTRGAKFYSSMGAALKIDPTRIHTGGFHSVTGCRLAAALRRRFKKTGLHPSRKFQCVYSDELLPNRGTAVTETASESPMTFNKVSTNGSLCHITAIFGMTLAGMVIKDIYMNATNPNDI